MITESVRGPGSYLRLPRRAGWTTPCRWCCAVALESNQDSWAVVPQKWRPAFSAAGPLPCWYRMNAASPERCRFGRCPSCHCTLRPCKGCGDPPERIVSARRQSRTGEASSSEPGSRGHRRFLRPVSAVLRDQRDLRVPESPEPAARSDLRREHRHLRGTASVGHRQSRRPLVFRCAPLARAAIGS